MPHRRQPSLTIFQRGIPDKNAELFLVEGTKQINRMEDIRSDEIESIDVDKDEIIIAKYRAIYGSVADKGVVIVHLKSNKSL